MQLRLDGRTALVTGATSGIGRAVALAFAQAGAHVIAAGRREPEGHETVERVRAAGGRADFVAADVTDPDAVERLVAVAVERTGRLDCAVNNAGVDLVGTVADVTAEDWSTSMDTNARAVLLCLRHEIDAMRHGGRGGAIVNVGSVSGTVPTPGQAAYGASKAAVSSLTRAAAREAGKDGIRVNEIQPALLMSEMLRGYFSGPDAGRLDDVVERLALPHAGEPQDGAAACLFLCSDAARYITGASLPVDGGFLLFNASS